MEYEGSCPKCHKNVVIIFDSDYCPYCGFEGYWDEVFIDDFSNSYFRWYWNGEEYISTKVQEEEWASW
jgi:hypothetical protein